MTRLPRWADLLLIPALNLGGIPPFSGFLGKVGLLEAGIASGTWLDYLLVGVSVLVSLLTLLAIGLVIGMGVMMGRILEGEITADGAGVEVDDAVHVAQQRVGVGQQVVRDQLSLDTWLVLSRLERSLQHAADEDDLHELLIEVIEALLALAGIGAVAILSNR